MAKPPETPENWAFKKCNAGLTQWRSSDHVFDRLRRVGLAVSIEVARRGQLLTDLP